LTSWLAGQTSSIYKTNPCLRLIRIQMKWRALTTTLNLNTSRIRT
jgi:hypothetical protein